MKPKDKEYALVYSSDSGRICPSCEKPIETCACKKMSEAAIGDGVVRIRREVKGRGGKTVTTISGIPLPQKELRELTTVLKKKCGSGGTLKDLIIEIQGDHVDLLLNELAKKGFSVKRSGG